MGRAPFGPAALALAGALLLLPHQAAGAQEAGGGDPGDPWFALDHVLDVAIEMAPADWDRLRRQTRTVAGLDYGSDCQAHRVFSWFEADVTVDGRRYGSVGVRKKGGFGSLSREKPALKLAFDKLVDGQALGGVLRRTTLNNSVQDPSLLNTCLAYYVFAAAGLPAPRCNYARVAVNGEQLGLYVHVEDIERSLLQRAFADAGGNLYEGGDFHRPGSAPLQKKTHAAAGDWSDVAAVAAALQDPSPAGPEALAAAVDLDRFLTFWAAEVLVGQPTGYGNGQNNFQVYREPEGRFVFIPWDTDETFIPGARALMVKGAIAHRLYRDPAWRAAYAARLRELLDTVWDEAALLRRSARMAAIVQAHALPEQRAEAAADAGRARRFIRGRRAEIGAVLEPEPRRWYGPPIAPRKCWGEPTTFELRFETTWAGEEGTVTRYLLDGAEQAAGAWSVTAGMAAPEEAALIGSEDRAVITLRAATGADSIIRGVTVWVRPHGFVSGRHVRIDRSPINRWSGRAGGAVRWSLRPGAAEPQHVVPVNTATLELYAAAAAPGAPVSGRFEGVIWEYREPAAPRAAGAAGEPQAPTLIINEVAARGEPRDWFELYNASGAPLALADFVLADDLTDRSRRFPFLPDLRIEPGAYLHVELDSDRWPGFALGSGEELGIWTWYGRPVAQVDWREGDSGRGTSYARVPDLTGPFQTVADPTPGAPNAGATDQTMLRPPAAAHLPARGETVTDGLTAAAIRFRELAAAVDGAQPVAGGKFDLYLVDGQLVYAKEPCADEDVAARFFLHVFPAGGGDAGGFGNLDFVFWQKGYRWQGRCLAAVTLPDFYEIGRIRTRQAATGQDAPWQAEFRPGAGE